MKTDLECALICRSPPNNQKLTSFKPKSPVSIKTAFGHLIPAKVEVKLAHSSSSLPNATNKNNLMNSNINHNLNNNANSATNSGVQILQRNISQPIDIAVQSNNGVYGKLGGILAPKVQHQPQQQQQAQQQISFKGDKKKQKGGRYYKNITFETPVDDPLMDAEFDFEKNLALFDKQAIWDKIDANQKPDLVNKPISKKSAEMLNLMDFVFFSFCCCNCRLDKRVMLTIKKSKIIDTMKIFYHQNQLASDRLH